jgi:hypothetical protein
MNNKLFFTAATVALLGAGAISATSVWAQTNQAVPSMDAVKFERPMTDLVDKVASRFNLNKADVQAVFDEARQEDMAKFHAAAEIQLTQLVTDGKLTEAQKQAIIAKRQELHAAHESHKETMADLGSDEHLAAMKAQHEALQAWAEQNDIPLEYVMPFGRGKGPRGNHMFIMKTNQRAE